MIQHLHIVGFDFSLFESKFGTDVRAPAQTPVPGPQEGPRWARGALICSDYDFRLTLGTIGSIWFLGEIVNRFAGRHGFVQRKVHKSERPKL